MCAGAGKRADIVYVKPRSDMAQAFSHISLHWIALKLLLFFVDEVFVQIAQAAVFMQNGRLAYRSS